MKVESTEKPSAIYIEDLGNNKCLVALTTNVQVVETQNGENKENNIKYVYDYYTLETINRSTLESDIQENFDLWLNFAKEKEYNEKAKVIRIQRDKMLTDTDWTQISDNSLSEKVKQEYQVYRQALRDIPEQPGFPYEVVFPVEPKEE